MIKALFIERLYRIIKIPYQLIFKKKEAWNLKTTDFLAYPQESLGFHYGCFLIKFNFKVQDTLEEHDVFHVITQTGIEVIDEICLQFYLFGNGKHSLFLYIVLFTGILFYPTKINLFYKNYHLGKKALQFYDLDFKKLLHLPVSEIQKTFNISIHA